jgi:hypothetical protein
MVVLTTVEISWLILRMRKMPWELEEFETETLKWILRYTK